MLIEQAFAISVLILFVVLLVLVTRDDKWDPTDHDDTLDDD